MSYGNNPFLQQLFSNQSQNFVPWSQQASQMLNFPNPFHRIPSLGGPLLPPNFLIQQQNNYYNSILSSSPLFLQNNLPQPSPLTHNPFSPLVQRPVPIKNLNTYVQKPKKTPEVICLDEESVDNIIVIEDSPEPQLKPSAVKAVEKIQAVIPKSQIKLQVESQIKNNDLKSEVNKIQDDVSLKRQFRVTKASTQPNTVKTILQQKAKKKFIVKDKYAYKLSSHEKHLNQLSEYRAFFPHETVTGPQFQAKLPPCHLFRQNRCWLQIRQQKLLKRLQFVHLK